MNGMSSRHRGAETGAVATRPGSPINRKSDRPTCFFEWDPEIPLARRAAVECVGTLLLMLAATGAGLTAQRLPASSPAVTLFASAGVTAGALVSLVVALGFVSGGHFNPLITVLQWIAGQRTLRCTAAYVIAQIVGAALGAMLADGIFDGHGHADASIAATWALTSSEVVASAGLMVIVFGCARSGRAETGPFAVGAWLAGTIVATPSASYANPAIALAAIIASGPISLPIQTACLYVLAEIAGALVALLFVAFVYPPTVCGPSGKISNR